MSKIANVALLGAALILAGCTKQTPQTQAPVAPTPAAQSAALKMSPPQKVYDGPFGLARAMSISEIKDLGFTETEGVPNVFSGKPPKPAEGIDDYSVVAAPVAGACRISATVFVGTVNGTGDQLKAQVDRLAEAVEVKYGKPTKKFHQFAQEVYERNPQFWMLGLKEDSIAYGYIWRSSQSSGQLPSELKTIEVSAGAADTSAGYATVRYTYDNFDDCQKEFKVRKAANF
ncbi:hypothetical protein [uncultured Massilia sp.]|uniref:hypothetical protein n=1 Tax=uncultured Massilia sp. TaxID=169973 RepID=UPI00258A3AD8|nr:hypothetical protein [uncultured Massilia sp.]